MGGEGGHMEGGHMGVEESHRRARGPLTGRVAIVTGASSGIGAAVAQELARQGARVVLAARREEELRTQVEAITGWGGEALAVPTDITDPAQRDALVARTLEAYGAIDILVNNAGIGWARPFARTTPEEITHMVALNLLGALLLTRAVLPGMLERRRGTIIAIASVAGHLAVDPLYSGTKYGLRGAMLSLRRQLRGTGVSVSVVSPGFIRTKMTRRNRLPMPGPEIVARSVARLATHPRREVIVPWYYHIPIWLDRAFPWLLDVGYHPQPPRREPPSPTR